MSEYKYLGQPTSFKNNRGEGIINTRVPNFRKAFWAHKSILKSKMKSRTRIKILDSCVIPVLT